jgi:hypothetical protein
VRRSGSILQKYRLRGKDDPRDRGPDFYRDPSGVCWYSKAALDAYADEQLRALTFRGAAPQPASLSKAR